MTGSPREAWQSHVSWNSYVFHMLEGFVKQTPETHLRRFVTTGEIDFLYSSGIHQKDPIPTIVHERYVEDFARYHLERK